MDGCEEKAKIKKAENLNEGHSYVITSVRKSEFHQGFGSIVMLGKPAEAVHTALTKTQ